jgi:hypothetical protein
MWVVVNMTVVGNGSCYKRVEGGGGVVIPYNFWWAAQVGSPASISRYYRVEAAPEIETQADKESRMNYSHGEGL